MKIKLAILESDQSYLNRIVNVFSARYAEKIQIYSFTNAEMAISAVASEKIDVLLANDSFEIDKQALPARCSFAYFVESSDVDMVNDQRAICKFQKAELIYKEILGIYSENAGNIAGIKLSEDECRVYLFASPAGGTGTSTMAAACAAWNAARGKRTLYISLDDFSSPELFFAGEGQADMSDVIFSLKSKKANLAMKLESYVRQDNTGVYFFAGAKFALDMLELKFEERMQLLRELRYTGAYDLIVVDSDFALDKNHFELFKSAHNIVVVSDGSVSADYKTERAMAALYTMDQNAEVPVATRFSLMYNKFSSRTGKLIEGIDMRNIGGVPVYADASSQQILQQLITMDIFEKLDL